ncbi:MAG TPA: hypothetical protein DIW44_05305 [Anaerolineaceae bacterium]|nr:hypothetical protein [Anaerolineaceae bacterium]
MALKGNLSDFSIIQLLNLINLAKKTGALYIESSTKSAKLIFSDGKLVYATAGMDAVPLIKIMARSKLIPSSMAASLSERYKNLNDMELGISLINSGYLTQDQVFNGLTDFFKDILRGLFTLTEGIFHFEADEIPPAASIPLRMALEDIIIEGSRQAHEHEDLKNEIPSLDLALKFAERPGINIRDINLNAEEWRVISYVSPKNSIKQIAAAAKLNDFQIRRVVYNLLQAGLVDMVRLNNPVVSAPPRVIPPRDPIEQRSLVNRVIDRIKTI